MVVSVQEYDDEGELTAEFLSTTPHYLAISVHQPRNYGNPTSHQLSHPQKRHHSSMHGGSSNSVDGRGIDWAGKVQRACEGGACSVGTSLRRSADSWDEPWFLIRCSLLGLVAIQFERQSNAIGDLGSDEMSQDPFCGYACFERRSVFHHRL